MGSAIVSRIGAMGDCEELTEEVEKFAPNWNWSRHVGDDGPNFGF